MSAPNLQEMSDSAATAIGTAAETVRDLHSMLRRACNIRPASCRSDVAGYDEAGRLVRSRPGESLLVCFGVGLIAGVVIAMSLRSR